MFTFNLNPNQHGSVSPEPEHLKMLPSWVKVNLVPYNHLVDRIDQVVIEREVRYEIVDELYKLAESYQHSLRNSDLQIAGADILMSAPLHLIFMEAAKKADSILGEISYDVSQGHYRLTWGCLEASPDGKRALHRLPSQAVVYGRPSCLDGLGSGLLTASMVAIALEPIVEAAANKPHEGVIQK